MPRYEVPKFMGYGDAIQANQTMSSAFKDLSNTSQNFLNYSENQKQNAFDQKYKTDSLNLETNKYNDSLQEKADAKSANIGTMKALYPTEYGNLSSTMDNNPNLLGKVDIGNIQTYNTNIAKANKEKEDAIYQASRDKINDGFERERIGISRANANKPSELDRIMSILAPRLVGGKGGDIDNPKQPSDNLAPSNISSTAFVKPQTTQALSQTNQPAVAPQGQQPLSVGSSNQPYTEIDYLTKGAEKTLKEDGNTYSFNPITRAKTLIEKAPEKDALATAKLRNELNDETISIQSAIKNSDKATEKINGLINNPNLKYATGALSFMGNIPGTPYKDIAGELEVVKGGAFSQAIESLRGLGAMSDADAKGVTSSIANLDRTQSSEQLKKQLGYIIDTVNIGKENAIQKLKNRGVNYQAPKETYSDEDILNKINGGK